MQTFCRICFYNDYRDRDSNRDNWCSIGRNDYNRDNYQSNFDDKPDLQRQLSDFINAQQSTNSVFKDTFIDFKTKLETTTKNHQASIQNLEAKFDKFADKQSGRPSGSLLSNTQPNPKGSSSRPYQPLQAQNEHINAVFTRSGKSYNPSTNPNDQQNNSENPSIFDSDDEDEEPTPQPQPKPKDPKPVKDTPIPKPYKPKISYTQRLKKEKMKAQYGKFLDMIRAVRINIHVLDVLAGIPNLKIFLKNSINIIPYCLYAKLSLAALKPTKMSIRLADRSFHYPVRIAKNMLAEVENFTFLIDFVILEMEEDTKVPLLLGRHFLHTVDAVIRVKQKQLNLGVGTERMIFHIDSVMKHSYSNDDTCFSIDVIDEILEEYSDALLDEGSKILHSIEGTILLEKLFSEFDEFIAMTAEENSESKSDTKEPPFEKIPLIPIIRSRHLLENPLRILNSNIFLIT
nr:reverse transcriptase domain-containing protein [Tanacetum cinerariifolium]